MRNKIISCLAIVCICITVSACKIEDNSYKKYNTPKAQGSNEAEGDKIDISSAEQDNETQGDSPEEKPQDDLPPSGTVLASFSTPLIDNTENRVINITLAMESINGYIIKSNNEFSFNDVVGRRTEDRGYKNAPILVDGKKELGLGGGICQISSTMYNAALNLGLNVTEHHLHDGDISYIENGKDACVSYGIEDFKFINNKNYDIKIAAFIKDDQVVVSLIMA